MAFGKKKKQEDSGASYFDNVGKTEAVGGAFGGGNFGSGSFGGGNFGATEAVPNGGWGGNQSQDFNATAPGTIPASDPFIPAPEPQIDDISKTEPAFVIPTPNGGGETQPVQVQPVVGWLVCVQGKNIGKSFQIYTGYNQIGRDVGQVIIPDEPQISRSNHMVITYDPRGRAFYIGTGDGRNIIYVNGKPLYGGSGAELHNYDVIDTGGVLFRFIGFCGEQFNWE